MTIRHCKIILVAVVALLFGMIALNNIFNYAVNFAFVAHVLSMDTLPTNVNLPLAAFHRAVHSPAVHHIVYNLIIAAETSIATLCFIGAIQLFRKRHTDEFQNAKRWAIAGLTFGFSFLVTSFITTGGEWFYLWLAPEPWSGALNAATRLVLIDSVALVFLVLPE